MIELGALCNARSFLTTELYTQQKKEGIVRKVFSNYNSILSIIVRISVAGVMHHD